MLASGLVLTGTALVHGTAVLSDKPRAYLLTLAGAIGLLAISQATVVGRFASSTLGPPRGLLRSMNRTIVPLLLLASVAANLASPETISWPSGSLVCHFGCPLLLLMSGGLLALFALLALRRADPVTPRVSAAAIGATAGAWASLAVSLQCGFSDPLHVLLTHVLPVAVLMLVTAKLGARFLGLDVRIRQGR